MKRIVIILLAAALTCACAKEETTGGSTDAKRYLDAYMEVNYPGLKPDALGVYTLEETPGTGAPAEDNTFVRLEYTISSVDGIIGSSTYADINKQIGGYKSFYYYGPKVWNRGEKLDKLSVGLEDAIAGMRVGGHKKVLIPGWLSETGKRLKNPDKYVLQCSGANAIYDLNLVDAFKDVNEWQRDSIKRYMAANFPGAVEDPDQEGFWYIRTKEPSDTNAFTANDTIYINYTAMRLDGSVIDSSIERTAKRYGFYSASRTYAAQKIKWNSDYTKITMGGSSSLKKGFAYAVYRMHHGEEGTAVFWSDLGYGAGGSGSSIPAYSPLRFDIEVLEND